MASKELRKLNRLELLQMLVEQGKLVEQLQMQVEQLNRELEDRSIQLKNAGNIAEAALQINGVMDAAQLAAKQYLDNVQRMHDEEEQLFAEKKSEIDRQVKRMLQEAQERCEALERNTQERCQALEAETKARCEAMEQAVQGNGNYSVMDHGLLHNLDEVLNSLNE